MRETVSRPALSDTIPSDHIDYNITLVDTYVRCYRISTVTFICPQLPFLVHSLHRRFDYICSQRAAFPFNLPFMPRAPLFASGISPPYLRTTLSRYKLSTYESGLYKAKSQALCPIVPRHHSRVNAPVPNAP